MRSAVSLTISGQPMPTSAVIGQTRLRLLLRAIQPEEFKARYFNHDTFESMAEAMDCTTSDVTCLAAYWDLSRSRPFHHSSGKATNLDELADHMLERLDGRLEPMIRSILERILNE